MMERAVNQFQKGLYTDYHPLTVQPDMLTDCLNGTIITNNGNEFMLQNDMGNVRVESARLPAGYVPIGTAELGGIVYVVSHNPFTKKCQIGSFPSPERNFTQDEINGEDIILDTSKYYESSNGDFPFSPDKSLKTNVTKLILLETLKVGEKYKVFSDNLQNFINNKWISGVCTNENDLNIHNNPRYLKLILVSIAENGKITYIDDLVWDKITAHIPTGKLDENGNEIIRQEECYYYIKPEALTLVNGKINLEEYRNLIDSNYNIASYKGFVTLGIVAQLECIDTFNVTWDAIISNNEGTDKGQKDKVVQLYWYLNWTYDNPIEESRNRINPYSVKITDDKSTEEPVDIKYPVTTNGTESQNSLENPNALNDYIYKIPKEIDIVEYDKITNGAILSMPTLSDSATNEEKKRKEEIEQLFDFDTERKNDGSDPEFILPHYEPLTYDSTPTNTERHNFDIIPRMPFGQMEWLKQSISLDLVKLGSGATDLIKWKYYKDEAGSIMLLNWGLEAYPERNKKIKSVTLSFKKFNNDFANIHKIIDGYEEDDPNYQTMEYNDRVGMFKIQKDGDALVLSKDVFRVKDNSFVPTYFYPKEKETDTRDVDYEIEYKDLPSYSGLFTAKIPLKVAPNEDSFEGEKAKTLDPDSVYLCQILINYNNEEYRVYYRFLFTSTVFNKAYFNEDKLDYKDLALTDYLNVNLGLSFDEGYPKISKDSDNNPDRTTKVVSNKADAINTGMDKVPTYQMTRGIKEFYIKDNAKLRAQFKYNITSDIPSLTFDLKKKPEVNLSENSYTKDSDYDMISSDLLLETPLESTFKNFGEPSNDENIKSTIEVNTTVPYRVLYNKPATLSNLVELQNLILTSWDLWQASWRDESRMWIWDGTYSKDNPHVIVSDHNTQYVNLNAFAKSLNYVFTKYKSDCVVLTAKYETVTTEATVRLSDFTNGRDITTLSTCKKGEYPDGSVRMFVFKTQGNQYIGILYSDYMQAQKTHYGTRFYNYLKSLRKYVILDEIIEVFEPEHINYYNNPKVKIPLKIETQGYSSDLESDNNYIKLNEVEGISIENNSTLPKNLTYIDKNERLITLNYYFTIPTYPIFLASLYTDQSEVYEVIERDPADDSIQDIRPLTNDVSKIYDNQERQIGTFKNNFEYCYKVFGKDKFTSVLSEHAFTRNRYTKQLNISQKSYSPNLAYRFEGEDNADQVIQINSIVALDKDTEFSITDLSLNTSQDYKIIDL